MARLDELEHFIELLNSGNYTYPEHPFDYISDLKNIDVDFYDKFGHNLIPNWDVTQGVLSAIHEEKTVSVSNLKTLNSELDTLRGIRTFFLQRDYEFRIMPHYSPDYCPY